MVNVENKNKSALVRNLLGISTLIIPKYKILKMIESDKSDMSGYMIYNKINRIEIIINDNMVIFTWYNENEYIIIREIFKQTNDLFYSDYNNLYVNYNQIDKDYVGINKIKILKLLEECLT